MTDPVFRSINPAGLMEHTVRVDGETVYEGWHTGIDVYRGSATSTRHPLDFADETPPPTRVQAALAAYTQALVDDEVTFTDADRRQLLSLVGHPEVVGDG